MFIKHTTLAISLLVAIVLLVSFSLDIYTHHGEAIEVPNFTGLTIPEVAKLAKKRKLRFKVIDSVYNYRGQKGTIVEQTPPADFKVKENRTVFLIISSYLKEKVVVPNVQKISVIQAKADLDRAGLMVGKLKFIESEFPKLVLNQLYNGKTINSGTKIPKGSPIDLVLGMSNEESTTLVPDLTSSTMEEAKDKATRASLNIGKIYYDKTIKTYQDSLSALVWKQNPVPSKFTKVDLGNVVELWLTKNVTKIEINKMAEKDSIQ
jgi:beta-lactam-binding protein with PASTA domain